MGYKHGHHAFLVRCQFLRVGDLHNMYQPIRGIVDKNGGKYGSLLISVLSMIYLVLKSLIKLLRRPTHSNKRNARLTNMGLASDVSDRY